MGMKASVPNRHTDEFKVEAVRLSESVGGGQAAKRLGIPDSSLWNWIRLKRGGVLLVVAFTAACGSTSETVIGPTPPSRTLQLGDAIPLDETVRISTSGNYPLPAGATRLVTRCTGSVTVMFSTGPGAMESNTCESADGTANQTNIVTGATQGRCCTIRR